MGMYNEVYKQCPQCGQQCYMQISQVVLGFGNFNLDNPSSMEDLTHSQKQEFAEIMNDEEKKFWCNGGQDESGGCGHSFNVHIKVGTPKPKLEIEI
jgi:hypothetical protein